MLSYENSYEDAGDHEEDECGMSPAFFIHRSSRTKVVSGLRLFNIGLRLNLGTPQHYLGRPAHEKEMY